MPVSCVRGARRLGHRRPRRATRDREALEQPRRDVRGCEPAELAVLVDVVSEPRRVAAREHARVREREKGDGGCAERQPARGRRPRATGSSSTGRPPGTVPTTGTSRSKRRDHDHRTRDRDEDARRTPGRASSRRGRSRDNRRRSRSASWGLSDRGPGEVADVVDEAPAGSTGTPKRRRKLIGDHGERDPGEIAEPHRLREQVGEEAEARDRTHQQEHRPRRARACRRAATRSAGSAPASGITAAATSGATAESGPRTRIRDGPNTAYAISGTTSRRGR